jgi:hypothetical protein
VSVAAKFGAHLIVIASGEPTKSDELPGADIAHHLARHGVKVEVDRIASTEADIASCDDRRRCFQASTFFRVSVAK